LALRKENLETRGYSVQTAASVPSGMKVLEEAVVDAVLLEYKQESLETENVAFNIKRRFPRLPIVLLSACVEMPERLLWLVDEYAHKSAQPEELIHTIERALLRQAS